MKIITVILASIALAFGAALYAPLVLFNAYAPDGPLGLYYGMSDGEMIATALIAVAIILTAIPAGITLTERITK